MSVANRIRIGFAFPLILVAFVGVIAFQTAAKIPEATHWVEHTQNVLGKVRQFAAKVTELANAQRAALAGGHAADPQFKAQMAAVAKQLETLHSLTADNPRQQQRITDLGKNLARWNVIAHEAILLIAAGEKARAAERLKNPEVKKIGAALRVGLIEIDASESRLLKQRHLTAKASAERAMYVIGVGTAIAILLGILSAIYIPRYVTRSVRELVQVVERIGGGTLGYKASSDIRNELGLLATAINAMSTNLETAQEDIQKQSAALTSERNILRALIDHLPDYIFVKDDNCRFVLANTALMRSQGITHASQLGGRTDFDYFPPELAQSYRRSDEAVLQSGKAMINVEEPISDQNGQLAWYSTTKVPFRDDKGTTVGLVGICHDITSRKQADDKIAQLNMALQARASELETVNRELEAFCYSVSHDLRAPLRHIDGFAELLTLHAGSRLDEKNRRYLNLISKSASELGRLIDDLLNFSRMGRSDMRFTRISLDQMVGELVRELDQDCARGNVSWKVEALPVVDGDPAMLRLVFVNLLSNALKYSSTRQPAEIEIGSGQGDNGEVVVFVRDNGVGFDMQYTGKLFGVFQRLHSADDFEGTGIGLANVRRIVHRHGGRTWAEGAPDAGATFYISLPRHAEEAV